MERTSGLEESFLTYNYGFKLHPYYDAQFGTFVITCYSTLKTTRK